MEYLFNLNRKNSEDDDLGGVKMQYSFTPQPSLSRKYSNIEIETLFKQVKGKTKIFGICGGTSCGKSKMSNYFHTKIDKSIVICEKDFLKIEHNSNSSYIEDKESLFAINNEDDGWCLKRKQKLIDYSDPDCYDWDKFINDEIAKLPVTTLIKNEDGTFTSNTVEVDINPKSTSIIFVEGIFLYKYEKLRDLLDFKIFVEVDEDIRLSRMVLHENTYMKSNHHALKSFFIIYEKFIKDSYEKHVEPSKKHANIILPNFNITPDDEIEDNASLQFLLVNLKNLIRQGKDKDLKSTSQNSH